MIPQGVEAGKAARRRRPGRARRQATTNLRLITRAEANGQTRLAASLRQVQDSLERIIPALEAIPASQEPGDGQS